MWQKRLQALEEALGLLRLAFPNRDNAPAVAAQGSGMAFVACGVTFEFFPPPSRPCLGNPGVFALTVKMPEAAMDKDTDAVSRQNDVGAPRQITPVETKTVAHGMEKAAHNEFRLCILATNAGHQTAALLSGKVVGHQGANRFIF
jgi:hypothetical protein